MSHRGEPLTETPRLNVLDGGKALHAAVKKYAGESTAIQRRQASIEPVAPRTDGSQPKRGPQPG